MKLIECKEYWKLEFTEHKPLYFNSKDDLIKYASGEYSEEYGYKEYERIPDYVEHIVGYEIDFE